MKNKKQVIAYLHSHWDREWYREFEIFRLRLLRVFDEVLDLLDAHKIPSFYFDGHVAALLDYLEIRPENEARVRKLIKEKKLFIGPFYCLVDEFLTDRKCFEKNLEFGLEIAREFGCEDFIGYLSDTFGHSQNVPKILKQFGIDKAMVWRGCPSDIPSEFVFNGVNTIYLIQGYFHDVFALEISIEKKAEILKNTLDKIAKKSSDTLLLPIGADHLGVSADVVEQIEQVNKLLDDYEIKLSSPFEYFEKVKNNFKVKYDKELRDNSETFILQGCYSSRLDLKKLNTKCCYMLEEVVKSCEKFKTNKYDTMIKHAYKLLLQNQAHDGICGCGTDLVHQENKLKYHKILQIAQTILKELDCSKPADGQAISKKKWVDDEILYNIKKIPITEDFKIIKEYLEIKDCDDKLFVTDKKLKNNLILLELENGKINVTDKKTGEKYFDFMTFVDFKDLGDSYNFGADANDDGAKSTIIGSKIILQGEQRCTIEVKSKIKSLTLKTQISLDKGSDLLAFKVIFNNTLKNHLLQAKFNLKNPITRTLSEDMNELIERNFDPDYNMRKHLPKVRGLEVKTNTAPMQRFVSTQGANFVTIGLTEYEIVKNSLLITLLRATGIISNPKNPSRSTPAGPPIETNDLQQLGENICKFAVNFGTNKNYDNIVQEAYITLIDKN